MPTEPPIDEEARPITGAGSPQSQQVCWTTVLEFVERLGINPTTVLLVGTPAWAQLPDDHPDKLAAVLAAGVHHALRLNLTQDAMAEASQAISAAVDWTAVARAQLRHTRAVTAGIYIPRVKEIA